MEGFQDMEHVWDENIIPSEGYMASYSIPGEY